MNQNESCQLETKERCRSFSADQIMNLDIVEIRANDCGRVSLRQGTIIPKKTALVVVEPRKVPYLVKQT